jgi:hypothetical protein
LVRVLSFDGLNGDAVTGREPWPRVALPDGKIGYVAPGHLILLAAVRLCYIKDLAGRWRIAGVISAATEPGMPESGSAK